MMPHFRQSFLFLLSSLPIGLAPLLTTPQSAHGFEYVIQISIDGLHAERLRQQMFARPDRFVNFQRLVDEGASTFNARTDFFKTYTLPNHTSMLTGRPVMQVGDDLFLHHGYTNNVTPLVTDTLHNRGNPSLDYVSSVLDIYHDYGFSTGFYVSKPKFVIYEQSYNETESTPAARPDQYLENGDQGPNKIDNYVYQATDLASTVLVDQFVTDMAASPYGYSFLHLHELDTIGHSVGWGSAPWDDGLAQIDEHLGKVFSLIDNSPRMRGTTAVIVTADHGGWALSHHSEADPNNYTIPQFVWGTGLAAGADLYSLNRYTRMDPGVASPDYLAPVQPIRNGGTGNLALTLSGLPAVDGSSINSNQDLIVTYPSDAYWYGASSNGSLGAGQPGDGKTWNDARNWARDKVADSRFYAGDRVILDSGLEPSNPGPTTIALGSVQVVSSLDVDGAYTLAGRELKVTSGTVTVADGSSLELNADVTSPISLMKRGSGVLTINGIAPDVFVAEGTLRGHGTIGALTSFGRIEPGDGVGTLTMRGDLERWGTISMEFEINGTGPGQHDLLAIEGTANVHGTLSVLFGDQFSNPTGAGQTSVVPLIQAESITGQFSDVFIDDGQLNGPQQFPRATWDLTRQSSHLGEGLFHVLTYGQDSVDLVSYQAIPGDANGDFSVDGADFNIWNSHRTIAATDWTSGDFNNDGVTNDADLAVWQANRFTSVSPLAAAVPEPTGEWLLAIGIAVSLFRRCNS